jgi:hypothetical protein
VKRIIAIIAALFTGTVLALTGVNAASANSYGPYTFCSIGDLGLCIISNGVGNQMTVSFSAGTNITMTNGISGDPNYYYHLTNGNGNCILENASSQVVVGDGACGTNNNHVWILQNADGGYSFKNEQYGDYMVIDAQVEGYKVWGGLYSAYSLWGLCSGGTCGTVKLPAGHAARN